MKPIKNELLTIGKCNQLKDRLLLAIHCDNAFTKVLFLNKKNEKQLLNDSEASLKMELSLFHSGDFEYAIEWLRDNAYIPQDHKYSVYITGCFTVDHEKKIKSILNRDVFYIDEYLAIAAGCKFARECIGVENLLAEHVNFEGYEKVDNNMLSKVWGSLRYRIPEKTSSSDTKQPCLFYVQGSSSAFYYFDEKGDFEYFDGFLLGTQTFLGLSKCLLNSNDVKELIELASRGHENNVDTVVKEILGEYTNSPYGKFSSETSFFPFGKCMEYDMGLECFKTEDVSMSLMGLQIQNFIYFCTSICFERMISEIYVCGDLLDSELFRKQLLKMLSTPFIFIDPVILDFKNSAILGTLVYEKRMVGNIIK